jgi:hypothetical protein
MSPQLFCLAFIHGARILQYQLGGFFYVEISKLDLNDEHLFY